MTIVERLRSIALQAMQDLQAIQSSEALEAFEIQYLGRKSEFTTVLKELGSLSAEERKSAGQVANEIKQELEQAYAKAKERIEAAAMEALLAQERVDVTEPGALPAQGHAHIVTHAMREIADIFARAGFVYKRTQEVEWDWYAFEALNMHKDHPARDEWETFFMQAPTSERYGKMILTPHATSGTARQLASGTLPLRVITMSKTYRRQIDVTHVPMFHQFDGIYVDEGVSVAHLLGVLNYFCREFFGPERRIRLRPFHFRFTEPSFEIDVSCGVCGGTGLVHGVKCRTCKRGWLELGGAGMLHPNVLKAAGLDPKKVSGLAFGWGVERTYMMKEGLQLDDIRTLYKNDLRFLQQF